MPGDTAIPMCLKTVGLGKDSNVLVCMCPKICPMVHNLFLDEDILLNSCMCDSYCMNNDLATLYVIPSY